MAFDDIPSGVSEVKGKPKEGESSFNSDIETLRQISTLCRLLCKTKKLNGIKGVVFEKGCLCSTK